MTEARDILRFPPQRRSVLDRTMRWVTLLSFTAGAIGLPLEPLAVWGSSDRACAKQPGQSCRCSTISRTLGQCCCGRGAAKPITAESASERRPEGGRDALQHRGCNAGNDLSTKRPPRSCCAKKSSSSPTATPVQTTRLTIESCSCHGAIPSALLLVCGDPRVLLADPALTVALRSPSPVVRFDLAPQGQRPRPALPPPKSLPA